MKLPNFEMKHFFSMGRIVFSIVFACSLFNIIYFWSKSFITSKITGIAMLVFYIGIILVFHKQYNASKLAPKALSENELDNIIKKTE